MSTPVIIEVRANEFADRDSNAHVPFGARAMVADALASEAAGAASYHWHGRAADGTDHPDDVELHSAVIRGIREHSDMMLHPTLGFTSTQGDAASRLKTIDALIDRGDHPDVVPVDFGAVITDRYDADKHRFTSGDAVLMNETGYLTELLSKISAHDLSLIAVVWSPGGVRTALRLREAGIIRRPIFWQLGFTGPAIPGGAPATPRQLEAFLDEIPDGEPWNVHVRDGEGLAMATHAMLRGGHVAIGLGDDPYTRLGGPSNADLVKRLACVAETVGRPLATASDARKIIAASNAAQ